MSQELVPAPTTVVNPATQVVLELATETTDVIAQERADVVGIKRELDEYAGFLDRELTSRLDSENTRSAVVGPWKIEGKAPFVARYPADQLERTLDVLIDAGKLKEAVKDRVLLPQPPKPSLTEINKLLKHGDPAVREAIAAVGIEEPQRRSVSVKAA